MTWGKKKALTAQHCTSGAYWAYFLLTGMNKVPENQENIPLSGTLPDKRSRKSQIERFIKKEGVYWGRVCSGNDDGQSPIDNPTGCFHSFAMTIGNNGVTIYQTMQKGWTMASDWGIKTYSSKEFKNKIFRATSQNDIASKIEFGEACPQLILSVVFMANNYDFMNETDTFLGVKEFHVTLTSMIFSLGSISMGLYSGIPVLRRIL